ncbi:acetyltransferase [Burkholderia multivorans]|uniref:acetyltransferase n=1 Tax=Burkholderia multivorans TaxID=87883 RepID=UPI0007579F3C|nr:acetyltransferase [Burkholderia multivorans]AOK66858.1 hexapeptide transferase [Burkholderia multivorans]KVZ82475.1 hexapeptide transferase [Burkholderia multivorans]MBU9519713.1 acetyltransferase [Burkholderia multivorans]PRG96896.1 hexapeptide transferase [Burkholderia multivorans]PRH45647.1 hexapeptide transferase [Burkholderia multivorans]
MTQEIVVVGAGGHAKVCIELLRAMGERVAYCIGGEDSPKQCLGVAVLKGDENLEALSREGYKRAFVAIGANKLRDRLATLALRHGYTLVNAISPSAMISPTATIGSGIAIMAGAVINAEASIGDLSIINTGATIDHDCRIGRAVHIAPQSALAGNVVVGDHAFLGIGTKVIPEIVIGRQATIGAGGVVVRSIADGCTAIGVPAKQTK